MTGFYRDLYPVKCTKCGFEGYDMQFEKFESVETDNEAGYKMTIIQKCPNCQTENTMEFINE